jgi:hypothetical protein
MRTQASRALAILLAFAAGFAMPASAQPRPQPGPIVWTPTLPSNEGIARLAAFSNGVMYAQSGSGYARSLDFGAHWSMQPGPDGQTGSSGYLEWASPDRGFAITSRVVPTVADPVSGDLCQVGAAYFSLDITLNAGKVWLPACAPVDPLVNGRGVSGFAPEILNVSRRDSTVLVAGDDDGLNCRSLQNLHPLLFITSDFGRHWRTISLPGGYMSGTIGFDVYDARHISVLASKARGNCSSYTSAESYVFATTDGKHFKRVFHCPGTHTCASTAWANPHRLLVGTNVGQLYVSNDQGKHFFKGALLRDADYDPLTSTGVLDPRYFWVQALSFANANHGFASTRGSGTWRTTDGGLRWVQEKSPECVYYPFGVGDVAAADSEHGITGGPPSYSVRRPGTAELGCIGPQTGGPQITPGTVVATQSIPGRPGFVARLRATGQTSVTSR